MEAVPLEDQGYISLEHDASVVREFQPSYIPGMIQAKGYMRKLFAGSRAQRSKKWIEDQIAIRVRRQQRLVGDNPLRYHAILTEAALRFADREQLLYIEHTGGSLHIDDSARVKAATLTFKHLSKLALTPEESAAWVERLAAER